MEIPVDTMVQLKMTLELSIVVPCLNEAETLAICNRKALDYLSRSGVSGEIVIGDNGSTDGSQQIAAGLGTIPRKSLGRKAPAELFLPEDALEFVKHRSAKINSVAIGAWKNLA
jgi:glycosyltransferase involved in cell wall biosynthesis